MNVIDFALDMEKSGRDFYRRLSEKIDRDGERTIFARMAQDEERIISEIRKMGGEQTDSAALDEAEGFCRIGVSDREALRAEGNLEAYRLIMEREESVLRCLTEAARREKDSEARDLLMRIAAEEERELESVENAYDFANAPNGYLAWREFSNLDEFHNFGRYEDNRRCRHTQ